MKDIVVIGLTNNYLKNYDFILKIMEILKSNQIKEIEFARDLNSTINILSYINEFKKIIVIDIVNFGLEPGTLYKLTLEDMSGANMDEITSNRTQISELLRLAIFMRATAKVMIIGIEPLKKGFDKKFLKEFLEKIPVIVNEIKKEVKKLRV